MVWLFATQVLLLHFIGVLRFILLFHFILKLSFLSFVTQKKPFFNIKIESSKTPTAGSKTIVRLSPLCYQECYSDVWVCVFCPVCLFVCWCYFCVAMINLFCTLLHRSCSTVYYSGASLFGQGCIYLACSTTDSYCAAHVCVSLQ